MLRKGKLKNQQKVFSGFLSAYLISFFSHYEMISQNSKQNNNNNNNLKKMRCDIRSAATFSVDSPELNPEQMGHSGLMSHLRRLLCYAWLERFFFFQNVNNDFISRAFLMQ